MGVGDGREDRVSVWRHFGPAHAFLILACILSVWLAAAFQQLLALQMRFSDLTPQLFFVPTLVGGIFGVLIVRYLIFRTSEHELNLELRRREAEIHSLNADLTARIEEGAAALLDKERQLHGAQQMEAIGRLAGGVAHDFNNLLASIMGLADLLLLDLEADTKPHAFAEQIIASAEQAGVLTQHLLALGRQQVTRSSVVDLEALVRELTPTMEKITGESVTLVIEDEKTPCRAWADPGQLKQVLLNLVINARDAIEEIGEVRITVCTTQRQWVDQGEPVEEKWVEITVRDNGSGMDEETRSRIFEPFFSTRSAGGGSGLGLSVVAGIVAQNGGLVEVESKVGEGSCFCLLLPATDLLPPRTRPEPLMPTTQGGSERIIVVEDDQQLGGLLERILEQAGYQVERLRDGEAAVTRIEAPEAPFDLMICDLILPGRTGLDVLQVLQRHRPRTRAVLITGYGDNQIRQQIEARPQLPLLHKPFRPAALLSIVRLTLDGQANPPAE